MQENRKFHGVDGPGTSRTWRFSVQQLKMFDDSKSEIGRAGFKHNSGDGDPIDCGDGDPFSWKTKLPDSLDMTPEARHQYIQFSIGSLSWTTRDSKGDKQCKVGGWSSGFSPSVSRGDSKRIQNYLTTEYSFG